MSTRNQQAQALGRLGSAGQEPEQTESHAEANEAMTARAPAAVRLEMDTGIRKPGEPTAGGAAPPDARAPHKVSATLYRRLWRA